MRLLFFFSSLLIVNLLPAQCGNRYSTSIFPNVDVTVHNYGENTRYNGTLQSLKLDLYTPKLDSFKKRPCVVLCFGGAFVQGDRTSFELTYFANYLAQRGYVCASIDYRLDDTANFRKNGESGAAVRAVQDAKAAIRFLKSKYSEFGIDTTLVFIGGTSAGGITALTLGYSQYTEFGADVRLKIDSLGGWEGTSNALRNTSTVKGLFNFSGAVFDTAHISNSDLPVYLSHATQDMTVPFYSGYPLSGQSSTLVHGSGNIARRMKSTGNYYIMDSFISSNHPAFASTDLILAFSLMDKTATSLKNFLYKIIGCENGTQSITESEIPEFILQNPVQDYLYLANTNPSHSIDLFNHIGQKIKSFSGHHTSYVVSDLKKGIYFINYQNQFYKFVKD